MNRLLSDAEKLTGKEYDISNFSDVTEAIHAIQTEMGITGTSAEEAAHTISGSVGMMKSAWSNWLTGLGRDDADMGALTGDLVESVTAAASNVLPRITQIFSSLSTALPQLVGAIGPQVLPMLGELVTSIGTTLLTLATETIPSVMGQVGGMAAQALSDSMGDIGTGVESLMGVGTEMVGMIADGLTAALPLLATLATTIADSLAASMPEAGAMIAAKAPQLVTAIANALVTAGPSILSAGVVMLTSLVQAVPAIIPSVISGILSLAVMLANTLMANVPTLFNSALAMFKGIALAVVSALPTIITTLGSIVLAFAQFLIANGPTMMASAGQMFGEIGHALIDVAPQIATALWNFICQLPQIVMDGIGMMTEAAGNFFGGFVDGIMGKGGDAQSAASDVTQGAVQAATENADASEAGQNIADSITAAMDFSAIETDATSQMESITANVAAAADGAPIALNLTDTSSSAIDTSAMDAPAQTMVQNAITAANSVDASSIGQQFSQSAAAGVDTSAMANQLNAAGAAAQALNQTATIKVEADLAGVQQLRSAASAVQGTFRAMSSAVQASMSNASRSATNAGASIRASMNIPNKTININVAAGSVVLPHFHMNGTFNPKTGAVPSVGVSWYAKGGIFDDPTIIGVGEKGPEAVVPIDKLADMLRLDDLSNQRPVYNVTINGVSGPDETARAVVRALRMSTV